MTTIDKTEDSPPWRDCNLYESECKTKGRCIGHSRSASVDKELEHKVAILIHSAKQSSISLGFGTPEASEYVAKDIIELVSTALKQELKQSLEAQMPEVSTKGKLQVMYEDGVIDWNKYCSELAWVEAIEQVQEAIRKVFQDKGDNRE